MTRAVFIFFVCVILPSGAWAQPAMAAGTGFDSATAASVWAAALSYIAPRSLQQLTIPQMTIWGLNGLAALDPDLNTTLQDNQIRLYGPNNLIIAVAAPAPNDAQGWGQAAARVANAAFKASPALQQAATQGLISSFFDELFNHFDPYSRYEPPLQAAQDQLMITGLAGAGLTFARQDSKVVIASVAADSPAQNAGLTPGAIVLKIDGRPVYPSEITNLDDEMQGIYGSTTTLTLRDPANPGAPEQISLVRAFIPPNTVFLEQPPVPGTIAMRITNFNKGTSDQFSTAIAAAMSANPPPTGLVIDLRGDRGGVLRQAVLVAEFAAAIGAHRYRFRPRPGCRPSVYRRRLRPHRRH